MRREGRMGGRIWGGRGESNPQPPGPQPGALTVELRPPSYEYRIHLNKKSQVGAIATTGPTVPANRRPDASLRAPRRILHGIYQEDMRHNARVLLILILSSILAVPAYARRSIPSAQNETAYKTNPKRPDVRTRKAPKRVRRLIQLGKDRFGNKDYLGAIEALERASRMDGAPPITFFLLGNAYYNQAFSGNTLETTDKHDIRSAVEAYETVLALDPSLEQVPDPFLLFHELAQCYETQERFPEALATIKKAMHASRKNPMPYLYGARIRFKMHDFKKSAENLYYSVRRARRIKMYPSLARLIKTSPHFSGMLNAPQNKIILDAFDAVHAGTLTEKEAKIKIKEFEPYRDALTEATAVSPKRHPAPRKDPRVQKWITQAHRAYESQHYREAIEQYRNAMSADASRRTLSALEKSLLLERIGSSYRKLGLAGKAIQAFERSIEEMPHNSAALYQLALSYAVSGQLGDALTSLNRSLDSAHSMPQLRKSVLMARTDTELEVLHDLPRYKDIIESHVHRLYPKY